MKESFSSNLLLAVPELAFGSFSCLTKAPLVLTNSIGSEDHVYITALDCKNAEDIPACIERLLKQLDDELDNATDEKIIANILTSQSFLQDRLNEINEGEGGYQHKVPPVLKEIISQELGIRVKEKKMLYLSEFNYLDE